MLVLAMSGIMSHRVVHGAGQGAIPDRPPDELRRLLTPRQICAFRAHQASLIELPTGIVVDPAAGSGGQLAAYAEMLQKSCLGIEMSPERAAFCADSMSALSSKTPSLVLCGDGLAAEGAMSIAESHMGSSVVSMIHVDPARPMDAQNHSISEMEPQLDALLECWSKYIEEGEDGVALVLDLSPRLASDQRREVEDIVQSVFPGVNMAWEWLSRGGGRVDRLTLFTGPFVTDGIVARCVRLSGDGRWTVLSGKNTELDISDSDWPSVKLDQGDVVALIDPVVNMSGLKDVFGGYASSEGNSLTWIRKSDRRPLVRLFRPILQNSEMKPFVQIQGAVLEEINAEIGLMLIDQIASIAMANNIASVQLRCSCDPKLHSKISTRLNRILSPVEGDRGFVTEGSKTNTLIFCRETV